METISHRELRNDSSAVLRAVESGESFLVTNRGKAVARLVPAGPTPDLRCVRPARRRRAFSKMARPAVSEPSAVALDELGEER